MILKLIEYVAWIIGWNLVLTYMLGASTVAVNWTNYVVHLVEIIAQKNVSMSIVEAPLHWSEENTNFYVTNGVMNWPAVIIILVLTVILVIGVGVSANVTLALVISEIIVLLIFIFACCGYVNRDNYTPFIPSNKGIIF